jgi:outer membrane protein assembly factor BamA
MAVAEEEASYYDEEEGETQLLNAEEVTLIATRFLRRLGNRHGLKPIKASLQGERYVVEVGLKKKIATVQIDATNEEIKEYEIKEKVKETSPSFPLTRKNILLICGIVAVSIFVSGLLGVQSLLPSLL